MIDWLLSLACGFAMMNMMEWGVHKYIFHGLGKNPISFWSYHLYQHHADCLQDGMLDAGYRSWPVLWNTQGKEVLVLLLFVLAISTLWWTVPKLVIAVYVYLAIYYYKHRKAHLDPAWAKRNLAWHYQHHCTTPNANWCVTWPWFDWVMGTRVK